MVVDSGLDPRRRLVRPPDRPARPGYVIGPFSGAGSLLLAGVVVLLAIAAVLAWRAAGQMARTRGEARTGRRRPTESTRATSSRRPNRGRRGPPGPVVARRTIGRRSCAASRPSRRSWPSCSADLLGDPGLRTTGRRLRRRPARVVLVSAAFWAAWRDDALSLLVALSIMAIAFFVVPTRAHERYLFPFFGLGASSLRFRGAGVSLTCSWPSSTPPTCWPCSSSTRAVPFHGRLDREDAQRLGRLLLNAEWFRACLADRRLRGRDGRGDDLGPAPDAGHGGLQPGSRDRGGRRGRSRAAVFSIASVCSRVKRTAKPRRSSPALTRRQP